MNLIRPKSSSSSTKPSIPVTPIVLLVCFLVCQFVPSSVAAGVIIVFDQIGGNVVATGSGTLDTTDLTYTRHATATDAIYPSLGLGSVGAPISPSYAPVDVYTGFTGPSQWGSGQEAFATSSTGMPFGIGDTGELVVPEGYVSELTLFGTATWTGQTLASLGLDPGTYTYTWGSGSTADSLTVQVNASAVPEPATIWLLATGAAASFAVHARFARSKRQRREGLQCPEAETE